LAGGGNQRRDSRRGREALPEVIQYLTRYRDLIDDWPAFEETIRRPLAPCIWANPARIDAAGLVGLLAEEGVATRPFPGLPGALMLDEGFRSGQRWWFCAGLAHAQEAVSQLPVMLMDLAPGQRVLDMCAAPGGKTAQIALAMGNRGTLIANDFSTDRVKALQGNLDRLGIVNVTTTCKDAANWPVEAGQFDRILLDAPCSSDGTLRRNPDLVGRLGPELSERMAARQRAMLRKAVQRCRPGGRILYSTCTLAPEENELVVRDILREYDGRIRLALAEVPGLITARGVTHWRGEDLGPEIARCVRVWPHHNDTGGFFMAVLEKEAGGQEEPELQAAELIPESDPEWLRGLSEHYGIRSPKLTTAGAMLLGPCAGRARIELDADQRDAYLQRREVRPPPSQTADLGFGQVIATYLGHPLGIAVHHRSSTLESLFPSRWSGCAGGS
jgi:NOL1/NOP2/sun family putative RNA methylase